MSETDLFGAEHSTQVVTAPDKARKHGSSDEWLTPPWLIEALGPFDLDPCSPGPRRPWDTAKVHYGIEDDGLRQPWEGRVFLNPPYSTAKRWMARLAEHGHGTALVFARTETLLWHEHVWPHATAMLFLRGRVRFHYVNGREADPAGAPSVLIAYGEADAEVLSTEPVPGKYVRLR